MQPPFDDHGIVVTVKPRVYIDMLGFETIRGTLENRTGRDLDLCLYLNLVDDKGAIVGHAFAIEDDFRRGARRSFEAFASPGAPWSFDLRFFEKPPPYARVARGFAWDQRALDRLAAFLGRLASWAATRPPPQAARPAAQVRAS